ncbi:MAG: PQQ-binding-like beta-propeller repeat protein [Verrucomicrobia bacterium]|nr:MAG: PQQ-binding-like beta-propeller repeat protein [Verrucomicrobiota bacterium]
MNLPRAALALSLAAAGVAGIPCGRADDWPCLLGPNHDATSAETGLVAGIPAGVGLPVVWKHDLGTGYSAPSVLGNLLVVFHRTGNEEITLALDARKGWERWHATQPTRYQDPYGYNNGPRCTPLLTARRVYTFGAEGKLTCLDAADGKLVWQRDTAKEFEIPEAFFGVGATPILEGGKLIVMIGGQPNSGVIAVDPETGRTLWESVGEKNWQGQPMLGWPGEPKIDWRRWEKTASYSTPLAATVNGERLVFAVMRQGLVALDPKDGAVRFSRWFRARVDDSVNAMSPVAVGNDVLVSSAYYRSGSVQLRVEPGNKGFAENWKGLGLEMHWSQPVLVDGHLYGFSGRNEPDAVLRCVEWKTGTVKWERSERWPKHGGEQPEVFGRGSFVVADGRLYALGEGGMIGIFKPNAGACEELARWQMPDLHYPCWAGPALSDRKLYVRSEDKLVCLDLARK